MRNIQPLIYGNYFHIYNRGINGCDLFRVPDNYKHFLSLYDQYISPVAETFAWVLMKNHFHLLVRIKEKDEIGLIPPKPLSGYKTTERGLMMIDSSLDFLPDSELSSKKYKPSNQLSHLFNAYAQAFNKSFGRTGSLFEHPFKRKLIDNKGYLKQVIIYIHNNPVHHGFCSHPCEYSWSSYLSCISVKPTKLKRDAVLGWFDNEANFKHVHDNQKIEVEKIEKWLEL